MLERMWRNGNIYTLLLEVKISSTIVESNVAIPQGAKTELQFGPAIPLLGIYPEEYTAFYPKDTCMCMYTSTFHNSKVMVPNLMPINSRLDKENVIHIHHKTLCSYKKEQEHVLCRNTVGAKGHYP